jgi:hypothetical protein
LIMGKLPGKKRNTCMYWKWEWPSQQKLEKCQRLLHKFNWNKKATGTFNLKKYNTYNARLGEYVKGWSCHMCFVCFLVLYTLFENDICVLIVFECFINTVQSKTIFVHNHIAEQIRIGI